MESVQPVFTVKTVYEAVAWYRDVLRFETTFLNEEPGKANSANYAVLRNGNAGLHLGLERDMLNEAGQGSCNFETKDFDETHRRAKDADVTFLIELSTIPTGQRTFGIKDPDGNLITFVEASSTPPPSVNRDSPDCSSGPLPPPLG